MSKSTKSSSWFEDLNEFVDCLAEDGDLTYISEEISPKFEIGGVLKLLGEKEGPAPLFTNIAGFPGKVVVGNLMAHRRRVAKAFGVPIPDLRRVYLERREHRASPVLAKEAPVKEVHWKKDKVNLFEILPALVHHEEDASPYLTCAVTFARDPGTGRQSMGLHRIQIQSEQQMAICLANPPLANFLRIAREMKRPLDVAVAIGPDPLVLMAAVSWCPDGTDKIDIAGGFRQKPVRMVNCETADLLVPASSQFVIEGTIDPDEVVGEGTFGDSSGTYVEAQSPLIRVTGLNHRENPLYQALQPWSREDDTLFNLCFGSDLLANIRRSYPFVIDLHLIRGTVGGHVILSVKEAPRPMIRTAIAAVLIHNPHVKMAIAVDEDIEIRNNRELQWAMATRFQADRDLVLIPGVQGSVIDPSVSPDRCSSKIGIDATFPKDQTSRFKKIGIPQQSWNRAMTVLENIGTFQKGSTLGEEP